MVDINILLPAYTPRSAGTSIAHINRLAEADGAKLPPILVHRQTMRVIDGMHRLAVAKRSGDQKIAAVFFDGSEEEAFLIAVSENITHGLPLSTADRKSAAVRVLASQPQLSDRAIAEKTGLSAKTIAMLRKRSSAENPQPKVRVGRDGRVRAVNAVEGRRKAARLIKERPGAPLREIARESGLSVSTVADVKKSTQCGGSENREERLRADANASVVAAGTTAPATAEAAHDALARMRRDPAVRMTDAGRRFLRWLDDHAVQSGDVVQDLARLPDYYLPYIAVLARECATSWESLAHALESHESQ